MTRIPGSTPTVYYRGTDFKKPFILNQHNIISFIRKHVEYEGKFVFSIITEQLGFSDLIKRHCDLSRAVKFEHSAVRDFIAAFVIYGREGDDLTFILAGSSEHFGKPSVQDMKLVGEFIADMLKMNNLSPKVEQTSTGNVFIRANLAGEQLDYSFMPDFILVKGPKSAS